MAINFFICIVSLYVYVLRYLITYEVKVHSLVLVGNPEQIYKVESCENLFIFCVAKTASTKIVEDKIGCGS